MARPTAALALTETQALWFRARRGHLAGAGAAKASGAAAALLGAQSQQLPPSLLALSQRTKGRPTAEQLRAALFGPGRSLVRTWGQRDTLYVFDPDDWARVIGARREWGSGSRRGAMPPEALVEKARAIVRAKDGPVTRSDLDGVPTRSFLGEVEAKLTSLGQPESGARRFAAGRLLWRLAHEGELCHADKIGKEQAYASRSSWFARLEWPARSDLAVDAAYLARRYLSSYAPATPRDLAHFFGARVREVRGWLASLEDELVDVTCGERKGLVALAADALELARKPPAGSSAWPLRLLPLWDASLMGHADKSWLTPATDDEKRVWRKGAYVAATAIARGRVVANWTHAVKSGRLQVSVEPLSGWRQAKHAAGLRREARAVAAHLGLGRADVTIQGS